MTCWEKPQFDHFQQPVDIAKAPSDDEYENEELTAQRHYVVLGNHDDSLPLAEVNPKQTSVDGQKYSPQYFESLNQKFNVQSPKDAKWKYNWQGPGSRCWCHTRLDRIGDICQLCKKEWDHWQLLRNIPDEPPPFTNSYNHLNENQQRQLVQLLHANKEAFAEDLSQLGHTTIEKHHIPVENPIPIRQRAYRVAPLEQEFIKDEVNRMLEHNLIQPSESPWTSPFVLVRKKNGKLRFCVDYRKLNSVTQ